MNKPKLFRRRFIPDELVHLKDDEIMHMDDETIVTRWKVLKPRKDFTHGVSCFFLKRGFKISKFFNDNNECVYVYCDIIETCWNEKENAFVFHDLLIDVIVYENGFVKVLDLAEVSDALDDELITIDMAKNALRLLDELLNIIYAGRFQELLDVLTVWE